MSTPATDSFLNSPLITTITGYIAHFQEQHMFTKERLHSLKSHFLITIGFLVLLYCLIHIQILFFWLLKFIFHLIFQFISFLFWLPLRTVRFLIPKTIDYDILFPVFWLCSISSFYISKYLHENIWHFFDQYLVQRYKIFNYNQMKREDIKRYVFVSTFIVLLILQSLFIIVPITLSIRNRHANEKVSSTPIVATTTTIPTAKSAVKDVVDTMSGNLYNRFIDAFKDENETQTNEKRSPLVSDEKLEDTFKILKKSITKGMKDLKSTNDQNEEKKSSRFQRWIVHYLKAPFRKWEKKTDEQINSNIEQNDRENESDEKKEEKINSSLDTDDDSSESDDDDDELEEQTVGENIKNKISSSTDDEDSDEEEEDSPAKVSSSNVDDDEESDDDESDDDDEEESTADKLKEQLAKPIEKVQNIAETVDNQLRDKLSTSTDQDNEEESDDDESIVSKIKEQLAKPIEKVQTIAETVNNQIRDKLSSSNEQEGDDEESGYDSDDEESSKLVEKIKNILAEPIEKVESTASDIKNKITSSKDEEDEDDSDEESLSITEKFKQHLSKPIETIRNLGEKLSSSFSINQEDTKIESDDEEDLSLIDHTKQTAEEFIRPIKEKISSNADELEHQEENLVDSDEDILEKSSKTDQIVEPSEDEATEFPKARKTKSGHLKKPVANKQKSLKKKKKSKTSTEKIKDKVRSLTHKHSGHRKKQKKSKFNFQNKLNGWIDEAWNIWHLTRTKLGHIFISSTKHARHLPRYNTTSLYTAYTDIHCYDYTKKWSRYRLLKRKYINFLDLYRRHSPFPVYLSVLRSNGPRCYRQYPDSSCGVIPKSSQRNFKAQLYRFVRFWAVIGVLVILLATIYKHYISRKQPNASFFRPHNDFDRSSARIQSATTTTTTTSNRTDLSKSTTQRPTSIHQQTISTNNSSRLNEQIENQFRLWLEHEQNDGYRNLSETCRIAINNTFLKQLVSTVDKQPSLS